MGVYVSIEQIWIVDRIKKVTLTFGIVYRPTQFNVTNFIDILEKSVWGIFLYPNDSETVRTFLNFCQP